MEDMTEAEERKLAAKLVDMTLEERNAFFDENGIESNGPLFWRLWGYGAEIVRQRAEDAMSPTEKEMRKVARNLDGDTLALASYVYRRCCEVCDDHESHSVGIIKAAIDAAIEQSLTKSARAM